ncbi:hypothetical protein [Winogradskyella sp.]|uniref:hypothetical protein n=1 Tax=Winogradskyella sp. TaxID=1883156 RepID=UPI00262A4FE4|nr:hypothetical protein [Winogradskyella sp.]
MRPKLSHRIIAVFLTLNFLTTLFPINSLWANNNGPTAPEAVSFEPVDATDMVSLVTGDFSYVLPLLNVPSPEGGYPISLNYHGGIAYDQEASWVGLGWNINPGAIDRGVNGFPDDWKGGLVRNRNYYNYEAHNVDIGIQAGISEAVTIDVGIGFGWDSNGSRSGMINLGGNIGKKDSKFHYGGNVSLGYSNTQGIIANMGVGGSYGKKGGNRAGINGSAGTGGVGIGANYSIANEVTNSDGKASTSYNSLGISLSSNGGFSGSFSSSAGIGSASFSINNSQSGKLTETSFGFNIPIIPKVLSLKFQKRKVQYELDETYANFVYGPLYYNEMPNLQGLDDSYATVLGAEHDRDYYMDAYEQQLPQSQKELVEFKDAFERQKYAFTQPSYDSFQVNAQGLNGQMRPRLLENGNLVAKSLKLEYNSDKTGAGIKSGNAFIPVSGNLSSQDILNIYNNCASDILASTLIPIDGFETYTEQSAIVNWNYNHGRKFTNTFGGLGASANDPNKINFYFDNSYPSSLIVNSSTIPSGSINGSNINSYVGNSNNKISSRQENINYVETFTNEQMSSTTFASQNNILEPFNGDNIYNRQADAGYTPEGIGGFRVTTPDGKTYHYSLPVYHFEEFYRQKKMNPDTYEFFSEHSFYHEQRKVEPYATHWVLTAITGPDYYKTDANRKYPNEDDYGYWIRFDYGKWTDGHVWRSPYDGYVDLNLNQEWVQNQATQEYGWGRKQLTYLNKIVTRTHTALFVKSVREDSKGKQIGVPNATISNPNRFPSFEGDYRIYYPIQSGLKLDEIILLKNEYDNSSSQAQIQSIISNPSSSVTVPWVSPMKRPYNSNNNQITYTINNQQNVLDNGDFVLDSNNEYAIYNNALKIIKFDQDYSLATNTPNSFAPAQNGVNAKGRLTLNSVKTLGKKAYDYMPPYSFSYIGKNIAYQPCPSSSNCDKDAWGYHNTIPELWSMNEIKTPTGSTLEIGYEEDDYWTEAFARRYWDDFLKFKIIPSPSWSAGSEFLLEIRNDDNASSQVTVNDFRDYFVEGEATAIEYWLCIMKNTCNLFGCETDREKFSMPATELIVEEVTANRLLLKGVFGQDMNILELDRASDAAGFFSYTYGSHSNQGSNPPQKEFGECPSSGGSNYHRHGMYYNLVANKVPGSGTGGGVRVKTITAIDENANRYAIEHSYQDPIKDRTSGITSFAPVKGVKYVAYQAELPGPRVTYEYVTIREVEGNSGNSTFNGETVFHFNVLEPATDIFKKDITIGNLFKSTVVENTNLDPSKKLKAADIYLEDNTAMIGSVRSKTLYNNYGHLITKEENIYKPIEELKNSDKGSIQESFHSMKSIYNYDHDYVKFNTGFDLYFVNYKQSVECNYNNTLTARDRYLNVSTKITYPVYQEASINYGNGFKTTTEFSSPDSKTNEFLVARTTLADGTQVISKKVPAYTKYPEMGSKVDNPTYKNMLTQEAMVVASTGGQTLNASITTWNDRWHYRNTDGTKTTESGVWRKHKNYVWKDDINPVTGTYNTPVSSAVDYFNWGVGEPTSDKWQKASEITEYTRWSSPVETKDINGNYASSKMSDNYSKVIASGNAAQNEMYYSGMEYTEGGNYLDPEIIGASYQSSAMAHTGKYSAKLETNNAITVALNHGQMSSDKYKLSVWVDVNNYQKLMFKKGSTTESFNGETVFACEWVQLNHYFNIPDNSATVDYGVINLDNTTYVDDLRIHPVYASMNSYVYDLKTDELTYILDANNMASKFVYDDAGRLYKTYKEIETPSTQTSTFVNGGFKLVNKYRYNYKDGPDVLANWPVQEECRCCNDDGQDSPPDPSDDNDPVIVGDDPCDFKYESLLSATIEASRRSSLMQTFIINHPCIKNPDVLQAAGLSPIRWRWITDYTTKTFSEYVDGGIAQQVPFAIVPCKSGKGQFNKAWIVEALIPTLDGKPVIVKQEVIESGCKFTLSNEKWADIEISTDYGACSEQNKYRFRPYVINPLHENYSYQYRTFNHISDQWSSFMPVSNNKNTFCGEIFYVRNQKCKSGYSNYQTIQYRVLDNENGDLYQSNPMDVYLDCTTVTDESKILPPLGEHAEFSESGTVVEKDRDGKIVNVYNINKQSGNFNVIKH